VRSLGQFGLGEQLGERASLRRLRGDELDVGRNHRSGQLRREAFDVEALGLVQLAGRRVAELAATTHLRWAQAADDFDLSGWRWGYLREIDPERDKAALDEEDASVSELQRCDEDVASGALQ
jgi:hypothetical protein